MNKKFLPLAVAILLLATGRPLKTWFLTDNALSAFKEFSSVTAESFPDRLARESELKRVVEKAEESVGGTCTIQMVAHNPATIYRKDRLRFDCGLWSKPGPDLPLIAEYTHRTRDLVRY